jgi:hypothetical protein
VGYHVNDGVQMRHVAGPIRLLGPLPTNRFIGEPGYDRYDTDRWSLDWLFEHRFNDQWVVRQNVRFTRNE